MDNPLKISIQRYSFLQNWFNGLKSWPRPPASVEVKFIFGNSLTLVGLRIEEKMKVETQAAQRAR